MWSQKSRYAVRALLDLAAHAATGARSSREIAADNAIPPKYLEGVLTTLAQAGLVQSRKGKHGGHRLARNPAAITLWDVMVAVEPGWVSTNSGAGMAGAAETGADAGVAPAESAALRRLEAEFFAALKDISLARALAEHQASLRNLNYAI